MSASGAYEALCCPYQLKCAVGAGAITGLPLCTATRRPKVQSSRPNVRFGPCVDGSPSARVFLMFCPSVGAAMYAAC
jgi:hypothetical protein